MASIAFSLAVIAACSSAASAPNEPWCPVFWLGGMADEVAGGSAARFCKGAASASFAARARSMSASTLDTCASKKPGCCPRRILRTSSTARFARRGCSCQS